MRSKLSVPRYGRSLREKYALACNLRNSAYNCIFCNAKKSVVKHQMVGCWRCKKCEKVFVGCAYSL